jgi:hypothetical protein
MTRRAALALLLLSACLHDPGRGPSDPREKQQAEAAACFSGTWPSWLDDEALADASRLDRYGATSMEPNASFRDATVAASPSLPPKRASDVADSSRYAGLLEERREFRKRCERLRAATPDAGPGLSPVGPVPR